MITFRLRPKSQEKRAEVDAAFAAYREAVRARGNVAEVQRLRNCLLAELGIDLFDDLRRAVAPAFAGLLAHLDGLDREIAERGHELLLDWAEARELRCLLDVWCDRWKLTPLNAGDAWVHQTALLTLAHWQRNPSDAPGWRARERRAWILFSPELTTLASVLEAEGREAAERELRARGLSRNDARNVISDLLDQTAVIPRRARRNALLDTDDLEGSELRSLRWLAAYCRGASDTDTARAEGLTRQAVTASNRRTAALLGLAYSPRQGRRRKQ